MTTTSKRTFSASGQKVTSVSIEVDPIPGPDFTVYQDLSFAKKLFGSPKDTGLPEKCSRAISFSVRAKQAPPVTARGLACRAYGGKLISVTLRCTTEKAKAADADNYDERVKKAFDKYARQTPLKKGENRNYSGFCPKGYDRYSKSFKKSGPPSGEPKAPSPEIFLNKIYSLSKLLNDKLLSMPEVTPGEPANPKAAGPLPSGLIAITGATDSSKSLITRGLIFLMLQNAAERALTNNLRKPHLVTFEDPIEQYYINAHDGHAAPELDELTKLLDALYIDYTPREKDTDAASLAEVTQDAL